MPNRIPLALLPGLLCDQALWQHQLAALSDLAACHVADFTRHDSIEAMARLVLDAMPERFALAGLSMGGYVALEIVRRAPDRVLRVALIDTRASPDTPEETSRRRGLVELAEKGQFKGVTPRLLPQLIAESRLDDAVLTGIVTDMAVRCGKEAFVSQQKAIMGRSDYQHDLVDIRCPTLVLCGRQDALTPVHFHDYMANAIPGARLIIVEDCGHLAPLERPDEVNAAMRAWLTDQPV